MFAEGGANFTDVFAIRSFGEVEIWVNEVSRIHQVRRPEGQATIMAKHLPGEISHPHEIRNFGWFVSQMLTHEC